MQYADETLISVVVLELGATWPPWLGEYQKHAPNSMVIAQSADESGADFARRIERKMVEVAAHEAAIHAGLLVSNGLLDAGSVQARERICAALLRVMLQKQHGELVLAADVTAADDVRHQLFALAGTLCDGLHGSAVSVRVRFDTVRPPRGVSGVMKVAPVANPVEGIRKNTARALDGSR